jgi:chaperone required for assembly of F1-ATPase
MKRFYSLVSTQAEPTGNVQILLDGKAVKMPSGSALIAPNQKIADLIMGEWASQEEEITPEEMPFTQILTTILDRISVEREAMAEAVLNYVDTDLVFYRTELPEPLKEKQEMSWDPWVKWFENKIDKELLVTTDLKALSQPDELHAFIKSNIKELNDYDFGILQLIVSITGSVILSFAFLEKKVGVKALLDAIRVEENYKASIYNEEKHGLAPHEEAKLEGTQKELLAVKEFLENLE